jgi:uncharacterized protein YwqG
MNRFTFWYRGLGKTARIMVIAVVVIVIIAVVGSIGYLVLHPKKVMVKYGTIVRDPVDGHVWEDKTKTAWVDPSEADNYRIEYIDKLSPEHEKEAAEKQAAQEQAQQGQQTGLTTLEAPVSAQTMKDMETLQQNIETMGSSVISGMEMAKRVSDTKATLVDYRNQIAATAVPPELEPLKQQSLQLLDMYIQACDLYLQAMANPSMATIQQANDLINRANDIVRSLIPQQ